MMSDPDQPVALHVGAEGGLLRAAAGNVAGNLDVRRLDDVAAVHERVAEPGVACVVVELTAPDGPAREAVATLRTAHPGLPVLAVAERRAVAAAAVEAGATETFVRSDADTDTLLLARRLEHLLGRTSAGGVSGDPGAGTAPRAVTDGTGIREGTARSGGADGEDGGDRAANGANTDDADASGACADHVEFLRSLHEVAGSAELGHEERVRRLLSLGREQLGLAVGFLARVELPETAPGGTDGTRTVVTVAGDDDTIAPGDSCPLSEAYCRRTVRTRGLLAIADSVAEGMVGDPAYERFGLDAYVGTTVTVDGELYGTLCFAAQQAREPFTPFERISVALLSELVGRELGERQRATALHRHGTVLNALGEPAYTADTDGRFTLVNDAFAAHVGRDREALLGERVEGVLPEEEYERRRSAVDELRAGPDGPAADATVRWEMTRTAAGGERVLTENRLAPVRDDDGTVRGTATVIRDISGRVRRRAALERERDRLAAAFDAAPYPFARVRFEGDEPVLERVNETFAGTFGCDRSAAAGDALSRHVQPPDGDARGWTLDSGDIEREVVRRTADGECRAFRLRTAVLGRGDDETTEGLVAYVDVTERRRQAEQLEQLRHNITDVVWMTDPRKETMEFVSEAYERIWGRTTESLYAGPRSFVDAIHPDDRERVEAALEEQRERPGAYDETYRVVQPDGEVRWVRDRSSGVYRDGELVRLIGIARDITALREREQELRAFRSAVEHAAHAITWLTPDGEIEYVNPAFEAQTGYDAAEAVGERIDVLRAGVHDEEEYERMWETLARGDIWEREAVRRRKGGERYIANRTVSPVIEDGELRRVVAVAADVTDRRRREQQLSVLQRVLRHDLRNSLNEILLAAESIERTDGATADRAGAIRQTVEETLSLVRDVKRMQELFEREGAEVKRMVDVTEIVAEQVATLRTERPAVTVETTLPEPVSVVGNGLLGRAVRNVLQNAVEHNDSATPALEVAVSERPATDEVAVRIVDNGPGIPDRTVSVLEAGAEEPLSHLDGFGLWLVQWVVSLSGGTVEFETGVASADGATASEADRGTAVTLLLPAGEPPGNGE